MCKATADGAAALIGCHVACSNWPGLPRGADKAVHRAVDHGPWVHRGPRGGACPGLIRAARDGMNGYGAPLGFGRRSKEGDGGASPEHHRRCGRRCYSAQNQASIEPEEGEDCALSKV